MTIVGEVEMGGDGILQGWCWDPSKPTERLVSEILIGDKIVATVLASRFREDLVGRGIGDGYHGFIGTLTKSISDAGENYSISARERNSRCCFWRVVRGESALPGDFASRCTEIRRNFSRVSQSREFHTLGATSMASIFSGELATLGVHLQTVTNCRHDILLPIANARAALSHQFGRVVIDCPRRPDVAIIVIADSTANDALSSIAALAPELTSVNASLLLVDRGKNTKVALGPSLFANLRYIFDPGGDLASLLFSALKYSEGNMLIFLRNPVSSSGQSLPAIVAEFNSGELVYINAESVDVARGICGENEEVVSRRLTDIPLGLTFAGSRECFAQLFHSFQSHDRLTGTEDIDLAIRALREGIEICAWDDRNFGQKSGQRVKATH